MKKTPVLDTVEPIKPEVSLSNNDLLISSDMILSMGIRVRKTDFSVFLNPISSPATSFANRVLRLPLSEEANEGLEGVQQSLPCRR